MTLVMGVLNVTPDSFSDGGRWASTESAVRHALQLRDEGADLIDVGGESTRPGATRVAAEVEQDRVLPVIAELKRHGIRTSVDTLNAQTAERAVAAGADIINDVSGGLADPAMAAVVARAGVPYIAMHWRAHAGTMDTLSTYDDVVATVVAELTERVTALQAAGVRRDQIILDPGLGFSKDAEQNWRVFARLDAFAPLGLPVMVGASRKRFLAGVLPADAAVLERDLPTAVLSVLAAQAGAWAVRVHDVAGTRTALNVLARVDSARIGS
ncbi:dihydropteroate synthase [Cryobacterium sp. 1639]|uniref:dihydropteroate synthase n=1 Tax=Cryobacterium inferilacus TaxID=2866629 RepID=UPI001C735CF3|nr:dihydropteroate synthase [Cryobacterium sp. 1639]MBX0299428.1 dihydropteroate synthase [Cryobacterium sp. 1639]